MKMKLSMTFAVMISTAALADNTGTNAVAPARPPAAAATQPEPAKPATSEAAKPAKKKTAARRTRPPEARTVPLVPGPASVSVSPNSRVMVRGRAGLIGEVIARMTNGEPVTVIEEVSLKNSKADEPSAWAKIVLPPDKAHAWVKAEFIDANKSVKVKSLNLRGGPGENYSVLGLLHNGDTIEQIDTKGEWIEIQAPTNAYAFVAAAYLKQETPVLAAIPPAETTTVSESPAIPPAGLPVVPDATPIPEPPPAMPEEVPPAVEEPPPPRIVQREGFVRGTVSIQAPTRFELVSLETHRPIDYLYTTSTNLDLGRYKGMHLIVTGEESLDERWKNTPVITIQRIVVIE
jgi:uncharacterized protein YgiM (DUF1202 family)